MTLLDALLAPLAAAANVQRAVQIGPTVVLWPDKERAWAKAMPTLRGALRHLLTLGP